MRDFSKIAATSAAQGLQYYDTQNFGATLPSQALPKFTGVLQQYSQTIVVPKNRLGIALTSTILNSTQINFSDNEPAGQYTNLTGQYQKTHITGSSGGFPVFYSTSAYSYHDANNLNIVVTIANPSAVNAVTPPSITVSGKVFLYLAPF